MSVEEYNGWSNRETWAFFLHLSHDQGLWEFVEGFTRDQVTGGRVLPRQIGEDIIEVVEVLWEQFEGAEWVRLMRSDVGSVWRIDTYEVGWHLLDSFDLLDVEEVAGA